MQNLRRYALGTGICVSAAGLCTLLLRESTVRGFLPFLFIGIVIAVAMRFGSAAGILGTIGAAMIFAEFLFQPVLNVRVGDTTERSNLIWMIIGGISASELVGVHPKTPTGRDDQRRASGT